MIEGEDGESYDLRRSSKLLSTDGDPVEGAEENVGETLRHNFLPSLGGLDQL